MEKDNPLKTLKLIIIPIIFYTLYACTTSSKHKSFDSAEQPHELKTENIWVSKLFKVAPTNEENVSIFVKHLQMRRSYAEPEGPDNYIERDVADYFLIVNSAASRNQLGLFSSELTTFRGIEKSTVQIDGITFNTETKAFNTIKEGKGGYYRIIAEGRYSPPDCGIAKKYTSANPDLTVHFIDAVSCGQLRLEMSKKNYKKQFQERIKKFRSLVAESFGIIRVKS